MQDLRYALRTLRNSPGFTLVAVLILGIGIGGVAGAFSLIDAFLLRPLPFRDPERLVHFYRTDPQSGGDQLRFSLPTVLELQRQGDLFEDVGAYQYGGQNLSGGDGQPQHLMVSQLTTNLLPLLGVEAEIGRVFLEEEGEPGRDRVVLLEYGLWQARFGGHEDALGQTVRLDGEPHTVVGVLPPNFYFPFGEVKVWEPLRRDLELYDREYKNLQPVARLKPGVSQETARAATQTLYRSLEREFTGEEVDYGVRVVPLRKALIFLYDLFSLVLLLSIVASAVVLLIICANVANLMISRATGRSREAAIRSILGASPVRLVRQLLTEGSVLALAGGFLGIALAYVQARSADSAIPEALFRVGRIGIDTRALVFTLVVSLLTTLIFALMPALQISRSNVVEALKEGMSAASSGRESKRLRNVMVVVQISLAVVLLVATTLLVQSALRLQRVDPGFETDNLITMQLKLPETDYPDAETRAAFYRQVLEDVNAQPGVESAAFTVPLPLNFESHGQLFAVEGREPTSPDERLQARYFNVSPGFEKAFGIRLIRGRSFDERDRRDAGRVVVINETMARRFWPESSSVGRRVVFAQSTSGVTPDSDDWVTVVGVVADTKTFFLNEEPAPALYVPQPQAPTTTSFLVVRTHGLPRSQLPAIRAAVWQTHPELPLGEIRTMTEVIDRSMLLWEGPAWGLFGIALVALLLAALGIYGVVAYVVGRRTHEIGVRVALGAEARDVLRLVLGQGVRLVGIGLGLGVALSLLVTRFLSSLLFGVESLDPLTFLGVAVAVLLVALLAILLPARRAVRVDPVVALRYE